MGNNSGKQPVALPHYDRRPHSVLGLRDSSSPSEPDYLIHHRHQCHNLRQVNDLDESGMRNYWNHNNHKHSNHLDYHLKNNRINNQNGLANKNHQKMTNRKAILPPLPRSQSFHQILRSTENGVNLLQKGTIRGAVDNRAPVVVNNSPVKSKSRGNQKEEVNSINPELNAILKQRRCKSETDLHSSQQLESKSQLRDNLENNSEVSNRSSVMDTSDNNRFEIGRSKGLTNGVAARIQRANKYRAPPPPQANLGTTAIPASRPSSSSTSSSSFQTPTDPVNRLTTGGYDQESRLVKMDTQHLRASKRSLGHPHPHQVHQSMASKPSKVNLVRRLSENSHTVVDKQIVDSSGQQKDLFSMFRLRPTVFCAKKERNTVFESKVDNKSGGHKGSQKTTNAENTKDNNNDHRKSKPLSSSSSSSSIIRSPTGNNQSNNRSPKSAKPICGLRDGLDLHSKNKGLRTTSGHREKSADQITTQTKQNLPPVFDDNFILKRVTPTAGLNGHRGSANGSISPTKERSESSPFSVKGFFGNRSTDVNPIFQSTPNGNHWQPPLNGFPMFKQTNSDDKCINNVSDSANYSDYDEDDSRELLHPYMCDLNNVGQSTVLNSESENQSNLSTESRDLARNKGLTNGVAARIQRAKYKEPAVFGLERNSGSAVNGSSNCIIKAFENLRGSKRSLGCPEVAKPKMSSSGLVRRVSEHSHLGQRVSAKVKNNVQELEQQGDLMRLLRLRPEIFSMKHTQNETLDCSDPEEEEEVHEVTNEIYGRLPVTTDTRPGVIRPFENHNNNGSNVHPQFGEYLPPGEMFKRFDVQPPKVTVKGQRVLPTTFDDNFILRRATPSAGLNFTNGEINLFTHPLPNGNGHSNGDGQHNNNVKKKHFYFEYGSKSPCPPPTDRTRPLPPPELPKYVFAGEPVGNCLSDEKTASPRRGFHKLNNSYISDSANYSDYEDGEEDLGRRVTPQRLSSVDASDEVTRDSIGFRRSACWTPLEDLTTSEEDEADDDVDFVASEDLFSEDLDNHEENELCELNSRRRKDLQAVVRCNNNTRFTLQNQLRTLIHNNKLRHMYP